MGASFKNILLRLLTFNSLQAGMWWNSNLEMWNEKGGNKENKCNESKAEQRKNKLFTALKGPELWSLDTCIKNNMKKQIDVCLEVKWAKKPVWTVNNWVNLPPMSSHVCFFLSIIMYYAILNICYTLPLRTEWLLLSFWSWILTVKSSPLRVAP